MSTLFPNRPETPLVETLRFLTDIMPHQDGSEQRVANRIAPRQEFAYTLMAEDGVERQTIENMFFDILDETFLIPVWTDVAYLTGAAAATATSASLDTTISDFRSGGYGILLADDGTYELLSGLTVASGSLGFTTPLASLWPAGTPVYPVRSAIVTDNLRIQRYATSLTRYQIPFRVTDNERNLGDGSYGFSPLGFGTDSAKLVIDDPNALVDTLGESHQRQVTLVDSSTGAIQSFSQWSRTRRGTSKTWVTASRSKLWQIRKLLHGLNGMQTSFLLPTFASDVTPKAGLTSLGTTLNVVRAGFSLYTALGTTPRKYIRVVLANGTKIDRAVSGATVVDATTEQITVTSAWGVTAAQESIVRIMILEKVRLDSDDVTITHADLLGNAMISMPVKAVLE